MEKIKNCILHIGTEKTGSTAIQDFMQENSKELLEYGYFYPESLSRKHGSNHIYLATYAQDDRKVDDLRQSIGVDDRAALEYHRRQVAENLKEELSNACGVVDSIVVSNEHCSSRLIEPSEVMRLVEFLHTFVENIELVVYLRPQHEMAVSLYSTRIKVGLPGGDPLLHEPANDSYYDHNALLGRWEQCFSRNDITVRIYQSDELVKGNVVSDFSSILNIPDENLYAPRWKNRSLSPKGLKLLDGLNPYFPPRVGSVKNPSRSVLLKVIESKFSGRGPLVDVAAADKFYRRFNDSNEAVRRRYFPERSSLFNGR